VRDRLCILNRRLFRSATPGQPPAYAQPPIPGPAGRPNAPKNPLDNQTGIDRGGPVGPHFGGDMRVPDRHSWNGLHVVGPRAVNPYLRERMSAVTISRSP